MKVYYVDAYAGKGKTHSAIQYAIQQAATHKFKIAIIQPSTALIDQTYDDLNQKCNDWKIKLEINKFHTGNGAKQIKDVVMSHLKETAQDIGEIMLITHQTFMSLPHWHNKNLWDVIIDEIPQIHTEWGRKLDHNFSTLTDHIDLDMTNTINGKYAPITVKVGSVTEMDRMANVPYGDEQDRLYQDIAVRLVNPDMWKTVIHLDSFAQVLEGKNKGKATIQTYSTIRSQYFEPFKTLTIMGAMFTKSVMYLLWRNEVEFVPHVHITKGLLDNQHTNGGLLTIKYLSETKWSKTLRDKEVDGKTVKAMVKAVIDEEMQNRHYIYASNNDDIEGLKYGKRLTNVSHGINLYKGWDYAVFLSALNNSNSAFSFMNANGVSSAELTEAQFFQTMYQFVMRISLRDAESTTQKEVIVIDRRSADYLQSVFPGSRVEFLPGVTFPEREKSGPKVTGEALSAAQRMAKMRAKKKAEQAAATKSN